MALFFFARFTNIIIETIINLYLGGMVMIKIEELELTKENITDLIQEPDVYVITPKFLIEGFDMCKISECEAGKLVETNGIKIIRITKEEL